MGWDSTQPWRFPNWMVDLFTLRWKCHLEIMNGLDQDYKFICRWSWHPVLKPTNKLWTKLLNHRQASLHHAPLYRSTHQNFFNFQAQCYNVTTDPQTHQLNPLLHLTMYECCMYCYSYSIQTNKQMQQLSFDGAYPCPKTSLFLEHIPSACSTIFHIILFIPFQWNIGGV